MIISNFIKKLFQLNKQNSVIEELMRTAITQKNIGNIDQAKTTFEKILNIKPDHANSFYNLGEIAADNEQYDEAVKLISQAIELKQDIPDYYYKLGLLLNNQGRLDEALVALDTALILKPDFYDAQKLIGNLYKDLWMLEDARTAFEKAINIKPDDAETYNNLGLTLHLLRNFKEARIAIEKAIQINSNYIPAYNNLGTVLQAMGDFNGAKAIYDKALQLSPNNPYSIAALAYLKKFTKDDMDYINNAEKVLNKLGVDESNNQILHFALGKMLDDCGEYDRAFFHYEKANLINREKYTLDKETEEKKVSVIIDTFTPNLFDQYKDYGEPSKLPVFIVGMPRSGTSLVEQIIASHPQVHGAGELTFIGKISKTLHNHLDTDKFYPECMLDLDKDTTGFLANEYLSEIKNYSGGATRVTDKMPANFVHLGLISILFPQAFIIHCKRDPLDICLSMYFNNMAGPQGYALNLTDLGYWYLQYERLMDHWKKYLPVPILDVNYDDLVNNQKKSSQQLIEYIGLDWDDKCITFHETNRTVLTASNWQVKQPLYKTSLNRWKNYEKHLEPLKKVLNYKE